MRISVRFILLLFIAAVLLGCSESGTGILYSIGIEEPFVDTGLADDLIVGSFAHVGDNYFIGAGSLFTRDSDTDAPSWSGVTLPQAGLIVADIEAFGGSLFLIAVTNEGDSSALYTLTSLSPATPVWSAAVDVDPATTAEFIDSIAVSSTNLYVNVRTGASVYEYYRSTNGTTFTEITLPNSAAAISDAVEYDGDSWVVAGSALYRETVGFTLVNAADSPATDETKLVGLEAFTDIDALFVLARDGTLYAYDGADWLNAPKELSETHSAADEATTLFGIQTAGSDRIVLAGTENGFVEIVFSGALTESTFTAATPQTPGSADATITTAGIFYVSSSLRSSPVLVFASNAYELFAGTAGEGLWRVDIASGTLRWNRD